GKVIKVADGDTITVLSKGKSHRVRFYGVDAPEKDQEYGLKSLDILKKLLLNKTVDIKEKEKDQYGRIVGTVYLDGENINLRQVKDGNAWWYRFFAEDEIELKNAEKEAREKKLGLWKSDSNTPPWEFRKKNR
ncbi:MAG: thermonuclease family protein, partial [Fusobacteriaceae bacterium]